MTPSPIAAILCPKCGRRFRVRPELAGRKATCACGHSFKVPGPIAGDVATAGEPAAVSPLGHDDFEALGGQTPPSELAGQRGLPSSDAQAADGDGPQGQAATRVSPILAALQNREDEVGDSPWRQRRVPAIALAAGAVIAASLWFHWMHGTSAAIAAILVAAVVQAVVFGPTMFGGLMLASRWFDIGLGAGPATLFKIAAVTLGPAAVADVLFVANLVLGDFSVWQLVAGFGYYIVLTGGLIAFIFEVGVAEMAFIVSVNFAPRVLAVYIAGSVLHNSNVFG